MGITRQTKPDGSIGSETLTCDYFIFRGLQCDVDRLRAALVAAVSVHDALHSRYRLHPQQGPGYQTYPVDGRQLLEVVHLGSDTFEAVRQAAEELVQQYLSRKNDLRHDPVVRFTCVAAAGGETFALVMKMDHTVCDGLSLQSFLADVADAYSQTEPAAWARHQVRPRLQQIAAEEQEYLAAAERAELRSEWHALLPHGIPELKLNVDEPFGQAPPEGGAFAVQETGPRYQSFKEEARRRRMTSFALAAAKVMEALQPAVVGGELYFFSPMPGRFVPSATGAVGNFVNLLPVLIEPFLAKPGGFFEAVRAAVVWTLTHQAYPFDQLHAATTPTQSIADTYPNRRRSIFIAGMTPFTFALNGVSPIRRQADSGSPLFDFSLWVTDTRTSLELEVIHRSAWVPEQQVRSWLDAI
ncbi:condensation domain-containing protein [Kribbella sp. NPDC056345]|uniref:condensation domain-containing protein n=1 Tax=Kribbella sp. NPDC056345 TaxID=3345789 RepID=UPI0035E08C4C